MLTGSNCCTYHHQETKHGQLLLEVPSDRQCGMCWWNAGRLLFPIDPRALESKNLSRTYAYSPTS